MLSCEDIVKIFYKLEEELSVEKVTKRVREGEKTVPAGSQARQKCYTML